MCFFYKKWQDNNKFRNKKHALPTKVCQAVIYSCGKLSKSKIHQHMTALLNCKLCYIQLDACGRDALETVNSMKHWLIYLNMCVCIDRKLGQEHKRLRLLSNTTTVKPKHNHTLRQNIGNSLANIFYGLMRFKNLYCNA